MLQTPDTTSFREASDERQAEEAYFYLWGPCLQFHVNKKLAGEEQERIDSI